MHNFFLHKNILIFRRFFNSANRLLLELIYIEELYHSLLPISKNMTIHSYWNSNSDWNQTLFYCNLKTLSGIINKFNQ